MLRSRFCYLSWQGVLILYGGAAGLWIAATLLGSLYIRQSLVSLHSLDSHCPTLGILCTVCAVLHRVAAPDCNDGPRQASASRNVPLPALLQVGLLTLHTLPTRETYALVRTLQVGRRVWCGRGMAGRAQQH